MKKFRTDVFFIVLLSAVEVAVIYLSLYLIFDISNFSELNPELKSHLILVSSIILLLSIIGIVTALYSFIRCRVKTNSILDRDYREKDGAAANMPERTNIEKSDTPAYHAGKNTYFPDPVQERRGSIPKKSNDEMPLPEKAIRKLSVDETGRQTESNPAVGDGPNSDSQTSLKSPEPKPPKAAEPPASSADAGKKAVNFNGRNIMVVEDVDINREIVLAMFEPFGCNVVCAENGIEAVNLFKQSPLGFDLILMDLQMPEMDGYEATRQIRAFEAELSGQNKRVPIIALTANVLREDIEKCLFVGMDDHIGKPLDSAEIMDKLTQYL